MSNFRHIKIGRFSYRVFNDLVFNWDKFSAFLEGKEHELEKLETDIERRKAIDGWLLDFRIKEGGRKI